MSNHYQYGYDPNQPPPFPLPSPGIQHSQPHLEYAQRPNLSHTLSDISIKEDPSPPPMTATQFPTPSERHTSHFQNEAYYSEPSSGSGQFLQTPGPPQLHYFPPPLSHEIPPVQHDGRPRPPLTLNLPPSPFGDPKFASLQGAGGFAPQHQLGLAPSLSPYETPYGMPAMNSGSASSGGGMTDYFPPYGTSPVHAGQAIPAFSPTWSSAPPAGPSGKGGRKDGTHSGAKTSRQQFTACGACRHRRVKCDLKDRQEAAELQAAAEEGMKGPGPHRGSAAARRKKVVCTNCQERGTNCVDEYAPLKAAKQLRRGKRISEIEMLYGKTAANAAVASNPDEAVSDPSRSPSKGKEKDDMVIPDLTKDFFESAFFRRWQVQRPIIDPVEFVSRYLAADPPTAAAMGPEGSILCHVLYAWAVSYGVDEHGNLDVPEGGDAPDGPIDLVQHGEGEIKREADRTRRKTIMAAVLEVILRRIDECGVMRKPSWDGVRALLLILPLTEGVSTQVERLAMYEAAISQVFTLCSFIGVGYDGAPSATSRANGGTDQSGAHNMHVVRIRIYWYAFVHEGITTGLKGGRLHLDDEDLETMQDSVDNRSLVMNSTTFRSAAKFATAPINLALACRMINKALTGPAAKRRRHVDAGAVKAAWEALESCWEEFDSLRSLSPVQTYSSQDEIIRFADGWKIFLFEAQNVIRKSLEQRLAKLTTVAGSGEVAFIVDSNSVDPSAEAMNISRLLEIAQSKCEVKTRQILEIVRLHVGTRFFEWDASLVRDGTYYAALLHAKAGGSAEDIAICIQALNELRWAHAKAWERSAELRAEWRNSHPTVPLSGWNPSPEANQNYYLAPIPEGITSIDGSISGSGSSYTSPDTLSLSETFSAPASASGPGSMQQHIYTVPPSTAGPAGSYTTMYGTNAGPPPFMVMPPLPQGPTSNAGPPPLYPQHIQQQPHQQAQGQSHAAHQNQPQAVTGQYVIQPDGSHVFIQYS